MPERLPLVRSTPVEDVVTVRGGPESVLTLQQLGLVAPGQATVLEGEPGWDAITDSITDIVTDDDQRRERSFGATDEVVSTLLGPDEGWRTERTRHDYPTVPGQQQVVAQYDGLRSLTASSAQGYADNFGVVVPGAGPYAAFDGNLSSRWVSSRATDPSEQWIRAVFSSPREVRTVSVLPVVDDNQVVPARALEVRAGPQVRRVAVNPSGAPAVARFDGSAVGSVQVRVVRAGTAATQASTGIREIAIDDLEPHRSFAVPGAVAEGASFAFGATAERRACFITIDVPDCSVVRIRAAEEENGMFRTFTSVSDQQVALNGLVVARGTSESARLLEPLVGGLQVGATSVYGFDPKVSSRFAYDGQVSTAWMSSPQDRNPTLLLRWGEPQEITGITVLPGESTEVPTAAVVRAGKRVEEVSLTGDLARFDPPLRTRELDISFVRPPGSERVVVPEVRLVGTEIARTLDPGTATGAECGLGPNVRVNGVVVPTRVTGTLRDVANGTPLRLESCALGDADGTVPLQEGENRLIAERTAEFDVLEIAGVPVDAPPAAPTDVRTTDVESWGDAERVVALGAGEESLLFLPENFNAGWEAELDGDPLTALRVDGWQQAWLVPAGDGGEVTLSYAPQRAYSVLLPAGLVVSGGILAAGLVVLLGLVRRRAIAPPSRERDRRPPRRGRRAVAVVSVGVATLVLLGPVALAGLAAGALARDKDGASGRFRPTILAAGAALAVLVIGSAVVDVVPGGAWRGSVADALAALGIGLLIGLALSEPPPDDGWVGA